jgi:release factor glutamine methyltransferase
MTVSGLAPGVTIAAARRALARAFRECGCDAPDLDARLLTGHALGLDHAALASGSGRKLAPHEVEAIAALASRRCAREPVARILGVKEFWGLPLRLSPETLVPRPETETVVEAVLAAIGGEPDWRARAWRVADLGTGSGALLLALLHELPQASGIGTDVSVGALIAARANAASLGLASRARFAACDFGAALAGGFDLVVSNPPYVASGEIDSLAPEVSRHDPRAALDGGADGFAAYREIAADARRLLAPHGRLILEIGAGQDTVVSRLLSVAGFATTSRRDLAGIPRAVLATPSP